MEENALMFSKQSWVNLDVIRKSKPQTKMSSLNANIDETDMVIADCNGFHRLSQIRKE
jgi:hypothetical protein